MSASRVCPLRVIFQYKFNFDQDVAAALRARPVLSQHGLPHSCTSVTIQTNRYPHTAKGTRCTSLKTAH